MEPIFQTLVDLGPVGVMLVLILLGWLVPKAYYEREVRRGDRLEEALSKTSEALEVVVKATPASVKEQIAPLVEAINGLRADLRAK